MDSGNENNAQNYFSYVNRNGLFGIMPAGSLRREEYAKYVIFMKSTVEVLKEFGIHTNNNGYSFMIDAVSIIMDMNTFDIKLNNDVYPLIAFKHDRRGCESMISHDIRNAIGAAYSDNMREPGTNRMDMFAKRPGNKKFLFAVTEAVCKRIIEAMSESYR
jgi:hypothetical protein